MSFAFRLSRAICQVSKPLPAKALSSCPFRRRPILIAQRRYHTHGPSTAPPPQFFSVLSQEPRTAELEPKSSSPIQIEDEQGLLNHLTQNIDKGWHTQSRPARPFLLFLVTARHRRAFRSHGTLLDRLAHHLLSSDGLQCVEFAVGMVDGLTFPGSTTSIASDAWDTRPHLGLEGICVALLDAEHATSDLWANIDQSTTNEFELQQTADLSAAPVMTFALQTGEPSLTKVQLPLAHTMFMDGEASPLFAQRWGKHDGRPGRDSSVEKDGEALLSHLTVKIPALFQGAPPQKHFNSTVRSTFFSRLRPITSSRRVTNVIGNVVSRLSGHDAGGGEVPASQELEAVIEGAVKRGDILPQQAEVWAFIKPQARREQTAHVSGPSSTQISTPDFQSGCRLHRVLSGGGGWGHKQGLVSLDPELSCHEVLAENPFEALDRPESGEGGWSMFKNVVDVGDSIVFYLNDHYEPGQSSNDSLTNNLRDNLDPRLEFGTLPSEGETLQNSAGPNVSTTEPQILLDIPGHFGALSRLGMSLEYDIVPGPSGSNDRSVEVPASSGSAGVMKLKTKLSPPYSLLTFQLGP